MQTDFVDELLDRVRSAAFSSDGHRRGWDAVRTAALLRHEGRLDGALELLDDVVARFDHEDLIVAAYACAVAIHSDLGNPATGIIVGRTISKHERTPELANALARAYWERFEQTGDLDDRAEWASFKQELQQEATSAA